MSITQKKPPVKLTVGAQYICFNMPDANGNWTENYEPEVIKLPTVTQIEVSENADSYSTYASGGVYDADTAIASADIKTTNIAFDDALVERMRGNAVDGGVVLGGGIGVRPEFAYGIPIKKKDGTLDLRWYPKCKLVENTDKSETSEESHKDQTDDLTIRAFGFNNNDDKYVRGLTDQPALQGLTEDAFFAAPLLTAAAVRTAAGTANNT